MLNLLIREHVNHFFAVVIVVKVSNVSNVVTGGRFCMDGFLLFHHVGD